MSTLEAEEEEDTRALGRGEGAFVLFLIPAPGTFVDDSKGASTCSKLPLLFPLLLALEEVELVVD